METKFTSDSWRDIQLVCFDVDGTLYDQRKLRILMIRDIIIEVLKTRKIKFLRILSTYRHLREKAVDIHENFESFLIKETANLTHCSEKQVHDTVIDWIHQRPLQYLNRCRYLGIVELFARLKAKDIIIGIFSDYPAAEKIKALGLTSDYIVCAGDETAPRLKPDPQGLLDIINKAGTKPKNTLLIGDREDRDGLAARAADVHIIIKSSKEQNDYQTFKEYTDELFCFT